MSEREPKRRRTLGRQTFLCGPPDDRCWVFGNLVSETHLKSDDATYTDCLRCGLPRDEWPERKRAPAPTAVPAASGERGAS